MITPQMFASVWRYRGFIGGSIKREFQIKYRNSLLGAAWTVLNPLAMIVVYTVIFSQVMGNRLHGVDSTFAYSIYLCAGVLTWGLFAEITTRSQTVFLENASLIKKLQFPRLCLPVIVVLNSGINFAIIFSIFTAFLLLSSNFPGWIYFAIFPVLLIQIMFSVGLGMILGILNVFFRDVGQFFTILLQFWFWLTPVVYPVAALPESVRRLLAWNPMAAIMGAYQNILVHAQAPDWQSLVPAVLLGLFFCIVGLQLFRRRAGEMVDEL
jgi:lipopolysaccharide transport system permease protein